MYGWLDRKTKKSASFIKPHKITQRYKKINGRSSELKFQLESKTCGMRSI